MTHLPPIGEETRRDILAEREVGIPLDGYTVAVVHPAQVSQPEMAGERGCFARTPSIMSRRRTGHTRYSRTAENPDG